MKMLKIICVFLSVIVSAQVAAESRLEWNIDLTQGNTSGIVPESHIGKPVQYKMINKAPAADYTIEYRRIVNEIETFNSSVISETQGGQAGDDENISNGLRGGGTVDAKCLPLISEIKELEKETNESNVKRHLSKIKMLHNELMRDSAEDAVECLKVAGPYTSYDEVRNITERTVATLAISRGEKLSFKINNKDTEQSWEHAFDAGERGSWSPTWGFAFFENKSEAYSTKSDGAGGFTVKNGSSRSDMEMTPVVMFSWLDAAKLNDEWDFGLTAGLGLDLTNPTVLVGGNWTYNRNVALSLGYAARKFNQLKSRYSENETLTSAVDSSELVDEVYKGTWYVSVTYRFGENPL